MNLFPLPFGSFANANFGGTSAFINPFNVDAQNVLDALLYPNPFIPQYLDLTAFPVPPNADPVENIPVIGGAPGALGAVPDALKGAIASKSGWFDFLADALKKWQLLMLAVTLLVLGLYFLAKQTDEGKALISVASKGAL